MMALLAALRSSIVAGVALAFLVLKPHLVLLLAPWMMWRWWHCDRRQIILFFIVIATIVVLSFLVQPDWLARFLARSGERTRAAISASVWGLLAVLPAPVWLPVSALVVAAIVVWAWRRDHFDIVAAAGLFVSPYIFSYNLLPLLALNLSQRVLLGFTVASWLAFGIATWQLNDRAAALITLGVLIALTRRYRSGVRYV